MKEFSVRSAVPFVIINKCGEKMSVRAGDAITLTADGHFMIWQQEIKPQPIESERFCWDCKGTTDLMPGEYLESMFMPLGAMDARQAKHTGEWHWTYTCKGCQRPEPTMTLEELYQKTFMKFRAGFPLPWKYDHNEMRDDNSGFVLDAKDQPVLNFGLPREKAEQLIEMANKNLK